MSTGVCDGFRIRSAASGACAAKPTLPRLRSPSRFVQFVPNSAAADWLCLQNPELQWRLSPTRIVRGVYGKPGEREPARWGGGARQDHAPGVPQARCSRGGGGISVGSAGEEAVRGLKNGRSFDSAKHPGQELDFPASERRPNAVTPFSSDLHPRSPPRSLWPVCASRMYLRRYSRR